MNKKIELSIGKLFLLIVAIGILSGSISYVTAGTVIDSEKVSYKDNSGLGVNNVQAAIDGTCANIDNRLTTIDETKLSKGWKNLTVPTPTKTTDGNGSVTLTYNIDLSNYDEVVPYMYVREFSALSAIPYAIPPGDRFASKLFSYDSNYNYFWDGTIEITKNSITLVTNYKSTNVSVNYFEIIALYVR